MEHVQAFHPLLVEPQQIDGLVGIDVCLLKVLEDPAELLELGIVDDARGVQIVQHTGDFSRCNMGDVVLLEDLVQLVLPRTDRL